MTHERWPNLFIIGAAKAGTTSLHEYLSTHPEIFMSEPKEPGYFTPEEPYYPKSRDWYLELFANAGTARYVGESSTHYTKLPVYRGVPDRLMAQCPDARLIYLMRDPIARAISWYWHRVNALDEHRTMGDAIREDPEYLAFSDYEMQLRAWYEVIDRERVLTLSFERMIRDPAATVRSVYTWLGVDPNGGSWDFQRANARPDEISRVRGRGLLRRFATSRTWDLLAPLVPRRLKRAGTALAIESVVPDDSVATAVIEQLRPAMQERVRRLEAFLGTEFPEWKHVFPPQ